MYFNPVEFGKRVRELRLKNGMTQAALSEELNISEDQLRKMECGTRGASFETLIAIAEFLNVSTDYLLMGRDYMILHSKKRLDAVLNELSDIVADFHEV